MSDNKKRSGGAEGGAPQKKAKGYWAGSTGKGGTDKPIPTGATGIYATCDGGKDKKAGDELIHMLEESFTRLGKDHVGRSDTAAAGAAAEGGSSNIAAMLAAEVAELKDKKKDRFKRREGAVRGTVFVEFPKADDCPTPEEVVLDICRHVKSTQSLPSRHLMRLLPVSQTCHTSTEEVTALAAKVAEQYFPAAEGAEGLEFAIEFEHRASDKLKRNDVIDTFAKAIPKPPHKVNLKTPQKTILVQCIKSVCAVAVVDSYKELQRFNVRKLAEAEDEQEEQPKQQQEQQQDAGAAPEDKQAKEAAKPAPEDDAAAGQGDKAGQAVSNAAEQPTAGS